jgi:hypothetical protein
MMLAGNDSILVLELHHATLRAKITIYEGWQVDRTI